MDVVAPYGDLVNWAALLPFVADYFGKLGGIDLSGRYAAGAARNAALVPRGSLADQVERRLGHPGQLRRLTLTVDVHVEDPGTLEEEVVVQRRHREPVG